VISSWKMTSFETDPEQLVDALGSTGYTAIR